MAIVKPIKVKSDNLGSLKAIIEYVKDTAKTQNGTLVFAKDCLTDKEFQSMRNIKIAFGKTTGRQYAHFVQSFSDKDSEKLTPQRAFELGKEFIARLQKLDDFQVVMATHTDEPHLHNHLIINSVSQHDGAKWQSSLTDLKLFREISDGICRENGLSVIERGNRGHKSYGEYSADQQGRSWKQQLAQTIADCLETAKSKAEFLHKLDEYGLDVDFGNKNSMFFINAGVFGLEKDMKCSDYALRSYGDFSKENIFNYFKANRGLLELALDDFSLLQDAFLEIGRMLYPNNPSELQDRYLGGMELADFDRMTREEIEAYLKRKKLEQIRKKALAEREMQAQSGGAILPNICNLLAEIIKALKQEREDDYLYELSQERELERGLEL